MQPLLILTCAFLISIPQYAYAQRSSFTAANAIPDNIAVSPSYRALLELMIERSPSFRRQCARIAKADALLVDLRLFPARLAAGPRGVTHFLRHAGAFRAIVEINSLEDTVEMIAHEFEHIIEQLDEISLPEKAQRSGSGVRKSSPYTFQTERSIYVGSRVAAEFRGQSPRED